MHRSILKWTLASVVLLTAGVQADVLLGTTNPTATPLTMTANTTSGVMSINVASDNPPNDVMAAWNVALKIVPDGGATGTLTFQNPATGIAPVPPNYIFGGNGLGIVVTNTGNALSADDFFDPGVGPGVPVPGSPGANLLQVDFLASPSASGSFGIYAIEGNSTEWTDSNFDTQFFSNVPNGTGMVLIGDVVVTSASVPLPSAFASGVVGMVLLAGWAWRQRRGGAD